MRLICNMINLFPKQIFLRKMLQSNKINHNGDTAKHFHAIATNFGFCCNPMKSHEMGNADLKADYVKPRSAFFCRPIFNVGKADSEGDWQ